MRKTIKLSFQASYNGESEDMQKSPYVNTPEVDFKMENSEVQGTIQELVTLMLGGFFFERHNLSKEVDFKEKMAFLTALLSTLSSALLSYKANGLIDDVDEKLLTALITNFDAAGKVYIKGMAAGLGLDKDTVKELLNQTKNSNGTTQGPQSDSTEDYL